MLVLSILANVIFIFAIAIKLLEMTLWEWNKGNENIANQEKCLSVKLKPSGFFSFARIIKQSFNFRG